MSLFDSCTRNNNSGSGPGHSSDKTTTTKHPASVHFEENLQAKHKIMVTCNTPQSSCNHQHLKRRPSLFVASAPDQPLLYFLNWQKTLLCRSSTPRGMMIRSPSCTGRWIMKKIGSHWQRREKRDSTPAKRSEFRDGIVERKDRREKNQTKEIQSWIKQREDLVLRTIHLTVLGQGVDWIDIDRRKTRERENTKDHY